MSSLHSLLRTGTPEQVQKALQELPSGDATAVNAVDDAGITPLHIAAERASPELVSALLAKGANPNVQTQTGVRAIHLAAKAGNDEVVQMLLKNGANLQPEDHNRSTPLHYAAEANQYATSRVLLELGSSVGAENAAKNTAAHIAAMKGFGNLLGLLVENGADLRLTNADGRSVVALLKVQEPSEEAEVTDTTLASDLRTLVNSPAHSDVQFKLADGVIVHAHKNILAARCPHWRARLQQEPSLSTVDAKDHKREVLLAALEYIYSGDTKVLHNDAEDPHRPYILLDLALYAHQWQLPTLAKQAEARIHKALTHANAVSFYLRLTKAGEALHPSVLKNVATYVLKNGSAVADFQSLSKSHLIRALTCVKLEARPPPAVKPERKAFSPTAAVPDSPMADVPTGGGPLADDSPGALSAARNIVLNMMKERMSWPFNAPVDPIKLGIPDYPLIIKHPMDLSTIKKKFKNYSRASDIAADVRLTFRNALTYNQAGSDIAMFAMNLLLMFEDKIAQAGVSLPPMSQELSTLVEATKAARLNPPPLPAAPPPLASPPAPKAAQPKKRKSETPSLPPPPRPAAPAAPRPAVAVNDESTSSSEDDGKEMTIDEKRQLGAMIEKLNPDQLEQVMDIMNVKENEVEVDIMDLDQTTLRKLRTYVNQCLGVGKKKEKDRNYIPKQKKTKKVDD